MKILIATGIYPPDIGGPAQYAKNTEEQFRAMGHTVKVITYGFEKKLPAGLRHFWFFLRTLSNLPGTDFLFILDTFSVALPSVLAASLGGKKTIIRTGGDFLWEEYVERTKNKILFKEFYGFFLEVFHSKEITRKEKMIFTITRWVLHKADIVIFSTEWQREIWTDESVYNLPKVKTAIIENYYGPKDVSSSPIKKNFISASREMKLKNKDFLRQAFKYRNVQDSGAMLDEIVSEHGILMEELGKSYAVIVPSISEISPNLILDAIRHNKPFIVTEETGLYERIKPCAIFMDPENVDDIASKIEWLSNPKNYEEQKKKVESFTFTHSWRQICEEIIGIYKKI